MNDMTVVLLKRVDRGELNATCPGAENASGLRIALVTVVECNAVVHDPSPWRIA